jgi:hypothetical protein
MSLLGVMLCDRARAPRVAPPRDAAPITFLDHRCLVVANVVDFAEAQSKSALHHPWVIASGPPMADRGAP